MKKKVLFCMWNNICETGVLRALKTQGYDVIKFERGFSSVDYDKDYLNLLVNYLSNDEYSFVFSMNYMPIISRGCELFQIPYVSWTTDSPVFQLYSETIHNNCNYIFIFDYNEFLKFYNENPNHIFYMPLGFDTEVYDRLYIDDEEYERYSCDVSFVGSTYEDKCSYDEINTMPEELRGYCDGLIQVQKIIYGEYFLEKVLTEDICKRFKKYAAWQPLKEDYVEDIRGIVANQYLGIKCTVLDRIETLRAVSERFTTHLYTLSDVSKIPSIICKGPADSKEMMPKIFHCSKINLNMTSRPIQTGIPQRVYDVMGVGGFMLTNYQSELPEYFELGKDMVAYESQKDLLEKIEYYLKHEEKRKEIATCGQEKVLSLYTYEKRLSDMLSIIEKIN